MTEHDLRLLCAREGVTLRRQTKRSHRGARRYWYAFDRHQNRVCSVYLCAASTLTTFTEADFMKKVQSLPGHEGQERLGMRPLPGRTVQVTSAGKRVVLSFDAVHTLAEWVQQQEGTHEQV
jgi:hypothetical protein